jgi:hypothetical protein
MMGMQEIGLLLERECRSVAATKPAGGQFDAEV